MKTESVFIAVLLSTSLSAWAGPKTRETQTPPTPPDVKHESNYHPDADLKNAPESYRRRVIEFRNMLRKEATRDAKVRKAVLLASDHKSRYRLDAIEFLGLVRAKEGFSALAEAAANPEEREFALYALGEIRDVRAIPVLIRYLSDSSRNVRGNSYRSLERIANRTFIYRYDDPANVRAVSIREVQNWWHQNKGTFQVQEVTPAEAQEAEEAWKEFGQQYLNDLKH